MFLGPWHKMKKMPKNLFIWWFLEPKYSYWLWGTYLLILGADSDKATGGIRSDVQQKASHPGATLTALEGPRKHDFWWGHESSFDVWPRMRPLVPPLAYKCPLVPAFPRKIVFRVDFFSLGSLVVLLLSFVFLFFCRSYNREESDS